MRTFTLLVMVLVATACSPKMPMDLGDDPSVEGEWSYEAWDIRVSGRNSEASCEIEDVRLYLGPWRSSGFYGRTEGGELRCSGDLENASGSLESYPVRRGGAVAQYIAFDFGSERWRHQGVLEDTTMEGTFILQEGSWLMQGRFRAILIERGPSWSESLTASSR